MWGKGILGSRNSKCKCPEAGRNFRYLRTSNNNCDNDWVGVLGGSQIRRLCSPQQGVCSLLQAEWETLVGFK